MDFMPRENNSWSLDVNGFNTLSLLRWVDYIYSLNMTMPHSSDNDWMYTCCNSWSNEIAYRLVMSQLIAS